MWYNQHKTKHNKATGTLYVTKNLQSFVNTYCGQHDVVPDEMFVIGLLSFLANFDSQLLAL